MGSTATPTTAAPAKLVTFTIRLVGVAPMTWNCAPKTGLASETMSQIGAALFCVTITICADCVSTAREFCTLMCARTMSVNWLFTNALAAGAGEVDVPVPLDAGVRVGGVVRAHRNVDGCTSCGSPRRWHT